MHTYEEIFAEVKKILVNDFQCEESLVTPDADLVTTLDLDSIDAIDLIVRLQNEVDVKVDSDDFKGIRKLDDVAKVIVKLVNAQ